MAFINLNTKPVQPVLNRPEKKENIVRSNIAPTNIIEPELDVSSLVDQNDLPNLEIASSTEVTLEQLLMAAVKLNASDLHLNEDYRPYVRVDGRLEALNFPKLTENVINEYIERLIIGRKNITIDTLFEYDMTYESLNRRFRVNIFRRMGRFSIVLRLISETIKTIDELDLPLVIKEFAEFHNGLVLITGPTGSGKSTTIATILNLINITLRKHIVTLEDPIEFVFPKGLGLIDQREYGIDFKKWPDALRSVLRQDPDVVMIGEMRDLETIESAIQISETGHLVFATLHTNSASQSIDRIVDVFPAEKQEQIKIQLSNVIRAVVSQRLVPITGGGRKAACEILVATPAVKNSIRENTAGQIDNLIQTGSDYGMISMERALVKLVEQGLISSDAAKSFSVKPGEIDTLLSKRLT